MDPYRLDSHKLIYHVPRLNRWLKQELIYPIYMEISPSGMCNHRCIFCALDFMGYRKRFLDTAVLLDRFREMGRLGVKSIMFGGEGEPFLHKDIGALAQGAKMAGIDVAFTTNGVLLDRKRVEQVVACTEWIKVSINAGTPKTYAKIHSTKPADFGRVLDNLEYAAAYRSRTNASCVLGMQILLLPENRNEIAALARTARDIGMDYLVVKPYSHHPLSKTTRYQNITYDGLEEIWQTVEEFNTEEFQVVVRWNTIDRWNEKERDYSRCLALSFWCYIDSAGDVWGCSMYLGDERFLYGNIHTKSFQEIWEGETRLASLRWVENELDARRCRVNCRMDKINQYLWELKHPPAHVNFI